MHDSKYLYHNRTMHKEAFTINVFKKFTDVCGGSAIEFGNILYSKYTVEDFSYADDMYYWGVLKYFEETVVPHKIEVYRAGIELSKQLWFDKYLPGSLKDQFLYNLWIHDMSKFSANESFGYACYNRKTGSGKEGFERAWHHHKMHNEHHPEHWFNPNRSGQVEPIEMPTLYIMEMIADWIGAGKTYGSTLEQWLPDNLHKFNFGTAAPTVSGILNDFGFKTVISRDENIVSSSSKITLSLLNEAK